MEARGRGLRSQQRSYDAEPTLIDEVVDQGWPESDVESRERNRDLVARFVTEVLQGSVSASGGIERTINARIAQIDRLISLQLSEVMHHAGFQQLEASWRGLRYLLSECGPADGTNVRVLNITKRELLKDF